MSAPVRGTQSFVDVMVAVWKRPGLTATEVGWRWLVGGLLLMVWWFAVGAAMWQRWPEYEATMQIALHGGFIFGFDLKKFLEGLPAFFLVAIVWAVVSAVGRDSILRRLDGRLRKGLGAVATLAVVRVVSFGAILVIWLLALLKTADSTVWKPMESHVDPSYVPGFALVLMATLLLFVGWSAVSWIFRLAPVLAMSGGLGAGAALRAAWQAGPVRGKLIEINLVMGIVKVALLVLALVFSACPLPFSSVETQTFLTCWWGGVGVWWLVMSDYFHVVRAAAYLRLWRAYDFPAQERAAGAEAAS